MRRFVIVLAGALSLLVILSPLSTAQSVSEAERQQFSQTTTEGEREQGVTLRSAPLFNQTAECWRCSSPCSYGFCCNDEYPQCCVNDGRCGCCRHL
ncbi:unnamed protein product [Orchesella dallaii]|uniref:Uncharacterized protein n=1 Tax=Orchesella dallaii TaxID=48710 RepID=A0ABP1PHJ4_9HEXA